MAEPLPSAGAAAMAIASAAVGAFLAPLGVTWALIFWGSVGCVIGMAWAPATGRVRGILTFMAAALLSAKAGTTGSLLWWSESPDVAQGLAAAIGIVFHPLVQLGVDRLPQIVARRFPDAGR